MTAEEKFWQLFMIAGDFMGDETRYTGGLFGLQVAAETGEADPIARANAIQRHFVEDTRLGIPVIFFAEALHGLVQSDATIFPQAIGLAASFDTALMHDVGRATAQECRYRGIRQVLSPVVNIASDVRWGRTEETYGEDPFLSAAMGVAFVSEFERLGVITTPKHFVANVGDGGRDSYPIFMSERFLRDVHLPPFEACIKRGRSRSVMTSYNSFNGAPCSASDWLNNHLLKKELGFNGIIISDAGAVGGANVLHFTAADYADAGARAISSGLDVIFQTSYDHHTLFIPPFLDGRIDSTVIDSAVARVLRAKFQLGLFEHPYVSTDRFATPGAPEHQRLALRAARESIVLLKNDRSVLPFSKTTGTLAVIGPDAAEPRFGGYSAPAVRVCSILDGLREKLGPRVDVQYAAGCKRLTSEYVTVPSEHLSCQYEDSTANGLMGEYFNNVTISGAPVFVRVDPVVQFHWSLFSPDPQRLSYDFYSVRWTGTLTSPVSGRHRLGIEGNDGYRLYIDDSLVIDNWVKTSCRTVMADFTFDEGRAYSLRLEYFEPPGNGRITLVWDVNVTSDEDATIRDAVELAARCDRVVLVVGLEEGEFRDRASLALPGRQEELIRRVAALDKPTAVVLVGGSAVTMSNWLDDVSAVLCAWYPGEEGGRAVADILFGDYSPSGRLPITFPVAEGQLPLEYNHVPTGRGDDYSDLTGQPLFPFGYGLSYTTFEYGDLHLDPPKIAAGQTAQVSFSLTNTGPYESHEVVQLYLRDELSSVARPITELKGFQKVRLQPGESQEVTFVITPELLTMLDADLYPVIEPGDFRIMIGTSSKDIRLRGVLTVSK
ncbi:MAG: glycoside hydrolase family 3 C-terminal domain-containing protein [candidate division Zixibacteria bacterium]|nr:glycoside hydrolase family 3 C-terminal domain-containing protein [candidate division Zixibacteria bacterium]